MQPLPPLMTDQRKTDVEHLNLLAIFHFICAGLAAIGIVFLLAHFALMHTVFTDPALWQNQKQPMPPPVEFFKIFQVIYVVFGLWFFVSGVLNLLSGLALRARRHRTFSLVVSGLNCLHIPLGTTLGVFTIMVLIRNSVVELYAAQAGPAVNPPGGN
jgi:uncharacterized membrane protein HdeD (DUF308 family)